MGTPGENFPDKRLSLSSAPETALLPKPVQLSSQTFPERAILREGSYLPHVSIENQSLIIGRHGICHSGGLAVLPAAQVSGAVLLPCFGIGLGSWVSSSYRWRTVLFPVEAGVFR